MITDYVKKSQRLTKKLEDKYPLFEMRPDLIAGGFGYKASEPKLEEEGFTLKQTILALVIGLPILFVIMYTFLALTPNI